MSNLQPTELPPKAEIDRLFKGIDIARSRYSILPPDPDTAAPNLRVALVYRTDALRAQRIIERLGFTTVLTPKLVLVIELPSALTDNNEEDNDNA